MWLRTSEERGVKRHYGGYNSADQLYLSYKTVNSDRNSNVSFPYPSYVCPLFQKNTLQFQDK